MTDAELERVWRRLQPLAIDKMAARHPAAARQPLRIAARLEPRALSAARACRRGQISDLDRRQSAAPGRLSGAARGQAGARGAASAIDVTASGGRQRRSCSRRGRGFQTLSIGRLPPPACAGSGPRSTALRATEPSPFPPRGVTSPPLRVTIASVIGRLPSSPFSLSITSNSGPTFLITAAFLSGRSCLLAAARLFARYQPLRSAAVRPIVISAHPAPRRRRAAFVCGGGVPQPEKSRACGLPERRSAGGAAGLQWRRPAIFRRRADRLTDTNMGEPAISPALQREAK
jgi:hypothetical protein